MKYQITITLCVVALCNYSFADSLAINNASFEDPVLSEGGPTWTNELPGWDGPENAGNAFVEYIDGFVQEGLQHIGIQGGDEVSQNLGVSLLPNSVYTLTLGVGNRNANFTPAEGQESRFGLYVGGDANGGGTLLADSVVDAFPLGESTFDEFSMSYTTGDAVDAGDLVVSLRTTGAGRAHYDNIRVDVNPVPEPSSVVLIVFGALSFLRLRRK